MYMSALKYLTHYIFPEDNMPIQLIIEEDEPIEVLKKTPQEIATQSSSYILYHLRVTFMEIFEGSTEPDLFSEKEIVKSVLRTLCKHYTDKYVACIEHFKSGMEVAKPHCHIYFLSKDKLDTIRKQLTRTHKYLTGNKVYSLRPVLHQDAKAFRYCMKQQKNETHRFLVVSPEMKDYLKTNFDVEDVKVLRDEAYAVWLTACEVSTAKRIKKDEANELQDRLFSHLDKIKAITDNEIKIGIVKFYVEKEKKPFNPTTARGYYYNYKITRGFISIEDFVEINCNW